MRDTLRHMTRRPMASLADACGLGVAIALALLVTLAADVLGSLVR